MSKLYSSLTLFTLLALLTASCGGIDGETIADDEDAIVNGEQTSSYANVGGINDLNNNRFICSGTLINKSSTHNYATFLTAAHCFAGNLRDSDRYSVSVGGQRYRSKIVKTHPRYNGAADFDLALIELQGVPSPSTVSIPTGGPARDEEVALVGLGETGDGAGDWSVKRVGYNTIDAVRATTFEVGSSGQNGLTCHGDSGGPVFRRGSSTQLGVHSMSNCETLSVETRTDISRKWIRSIALRAANGAHHVVAEGGGGGAVNANRTGVGPWERLHLVELGGGKVGLQTHRGFFLTAEGGGGGQVNATRTQLREWETFTLVPRGNGTYALRTFDGRHYLTAENGGGANVVANRTAIGAWEVFRMVEL